MNIIFFCITLFKNVIVPCIASGGGGVMQPVWCSPADPRPHTHTVTSSVFLPHTRQLDLLAFHGKLAPQSSPLAPPLYSPS